jgi:hypothetical protein
MCILWGHSVRRGGCPYGRPRTILFLRYPCRTGIESSDQVYSRLGPGMQSGFRSQEEQRKFFP